MIADNRLAENAGWDRALLAIELNELSVDLNFHVTVTGFETAEIDLLISEAHGQAPDELDDLPPIDRSTPAVSKPGEGGFVLFPEDAPWLNDYLNELLSFPNCKQDDQVDSTVCLLLLGIGSTNLPWLDRRGPCCP